MKYFLLPLLFFVSAGVASACSFTADADRVQQPEDNIAKYENIFIATVAAKKEKEEFAGNEYVFSVHDSYKGGVTGTITISSPGHSCGSFYPVGQTGLFFMNDIKNINESNPQYFYDSVDEAQKVASLLFPEAPAVVKNSIKACTKEYVPVCGEVIVQCVQAPCPPIKETFPNKCVMESQGAVFLADGACVADNKPAVVVEPHKPTLQEQVKQVAEVTNSLQGPTAGPLEGFVGPTTPPPSPELTLQAQKKTSIFDKLGIWLKETTRGLFPWLF